MEPSKTSLELPAQQRVFACEPIAREVLYIDDDPDDLLLVRLIASRAGRGAFNVTGALSLAVALERLQNKRFDLVIVDNRLGSGQRGLDALEALADRLGDAKVILVSDYMQDIDPATLPGRVAGVVSKQDFHKIFDVGWPY
ncbi:MAG: response regulator [Devosiaceae bacterium]|nr:response regulator [Devosiaceae bacterium MH13]